MNLTLVSHRCWGTMYPMEGERLTGWLRVRVRPSEKEAIIKEAAEAGLGLSDWCRGVLTKACEEEADARRATRGAGG